MQVGTTSTLLSSLDINHDISNIVRYGKKQLKEVRSRLDQFLDDLLKPIGRSERQKWGAQYVQGLLSQAERKTVSAISTRSLDNNHQAIQQLLHSSPWDSDPVRLSMTRKAMAELEPVEVSIIDDTGFPKKGKHSVGVARQYSGTLGKMVAVPADKG